MDFQSDLKIFYSDTARPFFVNGDEQHTFFGLLRAADQTEYETTIISTHTLTHPTAVGLVVGDVLTIDDVDYKVAAKPMRIRVSESITHLVKQ